MEAIIAVDTGTTGTKAAFVNRKGEILGSSYQGYPLHAEGNRVEQNPADWWQAACVCLRNLAAEHPEIEPAGIALSGQMQDVILVDGYEGPAILYSDSRAHQEAQHVTGVLGDDHLREVTANLQDASGLLAKLLWVKAHQPEAYQKARLLLTGAHDYVAWRLCGTAASDFTTAATTGLLNLAENRWAVELLEALELRSDWLAELVPASKIIGSLSPEAASACGLPAGLPVIHGSGDAAAATLGAGAGAPGQSYVYLGTSGWLASTITGAAVDPRTGIFNLRHPDPEKIILIGPMLTAAGNFEWIRGQFGNLEIAASGSKANAYDVLDAAAAESPVGSRGLLYLPYLAGERAPFRDPNARGAWVGLGTGSTRADLYRSVLEGVAYAMRSIRETMYPAASDAISNLNLVGGGARSSLWAQIFADVFACRVNVLADPENVGTRGAALIGGTALGWFDNYTPCGDYFPVAGQFDPQPANTGVYQQYYEVFKQLYPALRPAYAALSAVRD